MGIDLHAARLLMLAKREGADFASAATLGHQWLQVELQDLRILLKEMQVDVDEQLFNNIEKTAPYADGLLSALGAATVVSFDASPYEQATIIHDMNVDLPQDLEGKFSLLLDGGTLEHIFNFPTAIRNCMKLLRVGGHFLTITPANNFMGHGFYQFSPELFYRVLAPENGFEIERMFVSEVASWGAWYELTDPAVIGQRIELTNDMQIYLLIIARKISDTPPFREVPQQSDYEQMSWAGLGPSGHSMRDKRRAQLRRVVPAWLRTLRHWMLRRIKPSFSAKYFRRVNRRTLHDAMNK